MFVLRFRKTYIAHYNVKKFNICLFLFFGSIVTLVSRGTRLNLMIGWDGLGLTSICLIMFYPNNLTLYNSVLTMFFNRLGDVALVAVLSLYLSSFRQNIIRGFRGGITILTLLIFCSFSKRAQFPLSSWLPAAISAPTPISAIVHSSTLVTAGLFIVSKIHTHLTQLELMTIPLVVRALTFFVGGVLASLEADFKKIVAFSTMSQISIMMLFCTAFSVWPCFSHICFHAFFKTTLFVVCGGAFLTIFRAQLKKLVALGSSDYLLPAFFFLRTFIITGIIFSSSFFRKDLVLEKSLDYFLGYLALIIFLGSIATMLYCSTLLKRIKFGAVFSVNLEKWKGEKLNFLLFVTLTVSIPFITKWFSEIVTPPFLRSEEVIFVTVALAMILLVKAPSSSGNLPYTVSVIKIYSYSSFKNILASTEGAKFSLRESIAIKPNLLKTTETRRVVWLVSRWRLILILTIIFYSHSLIERGIEATKVKEYNFLPKL